MKRRLFVSRDAGAIAVGADHVAIALADAAKRAELDIEIVRTGRIAMVRGTTPPDKSIRRAAYPQVAGADVSAGSV